MTPERFLERASAEKALSEQLKATGQEVTEDTLRGCVMAAVQLAHRMKLKESDLKGLFDVEWMMWTQYLTAKKALADKRKGTK
jgi:hypothetical protein